MSTAFNLLRFDQKLLIYDLKKALLQVGLYPEDTKRLCFLWYKQLHVGDIVLIADPMVKPVNYPSQGV